MRIVVIFLFINIYLGTAQNPFNLDYYPDNYVIQFEDSDAVWLSGNHIFYFGGNSGWTRIEFDGTKAILKCIINQNGKIKGSFQKNRKSSSLEVDLLFEDGSRHKFKSELAATMKPYKGVFKNEASNEALGIGVSVANLFGMGLSTNVETKGICIDFPLSEKDLIALTNAPIVGLEYNFNNDVIQTLKAKKKKAQEFFKASKKEVELIFSLQDQKEIDFKNVLVGKYFPEQISLSISDSPTGSVPPSREQTIEAIEQIIGFSLSGAPQFSFKIGKSQKIFGLKFYGSNRQQEKLIKRGLDIFASQVVLPKDTSGKTLTADFSSIYGWHFNEIVIVKS